ncbi:MAG TPA: hypothetical protein VHE57_01755 [Mycobacteriales bacterium]|nr:hypothetical protein [Mycobacteriales bacterium]
MTNWHLDLRPQRPERHRNQANASANVDATRPWGGAADPRLDEILARLDQLAATVDQLAVTVGQLSEAVGRAEKPVKPRTTRSRSLRTPAASADRTDAGDPA